MPFFTTQFFISNITVQRLPGFRKSQCLQALLLVFYMFLCHSSGVFCQVKLPALVRDSMVLQRETNIKLWGWASPQEKVTIKFRGKKMVTTASADGKWMITINPLKAGGPYEMQIDASNHIRLKNILIGDVWLCSGQSNMVHQMELHKETYEQEIEKDNYPEIRQFHIPTRFQLQHPMDDLPGGYWKSATESHISQFSAVAYFFAKRIYQNHRIPIGLINASVGGTPIEAWMSESGLSNFPAITNNIRQNKDTAVINALTRKAVNISSGNQRQNDSGLTGPAPWFARWYIPKGWKKIMLPGYWEDQGVKDLDGVTWYRKEIEVPLSMTGIPAKLTLGRIVDADVVYVNGKLAGSTGYQYPQRRYFLPAGLLEAGKNIITIRIINYSGKGGFVPDKPYSLSAGAEHIDLKGEWQYKVGEVYLPATTSAGSQNFSHQNQPTALYNAMIAPLVNYNLKGILWYQGESNVSNAVNYANLLPALIRDWRARWKQIDLPFLYVQLPNFLDVQYLPSASQWAMLREAQLKSLSVPGTGMAVAIDLGEWNDIHPDNKKDVGLRLALAAENVAYQNKHMVCSGPLFKSDTIVGSKIMLSFTHAGSGLQSKDGEALKWFAISGADKKFVWASTQIIGDKIIVWSDQIVNPVYVRYAWADNPDDVNFYNKEGLPASPFRTDK